VEEANGQWSAGDEGGDEGVRVCLSLRHALMLCRQRLIHGTSYRGQHMGMRQKLRVRPRIPDRRQWNIGGLDCSVRVPLVRLAIEGSSESGFWVPGGTKTQCKAALDTGALATLLRRLTPPA
jgi:hypothetical protein